MRFNEMKYDDAIPVDGYGPGFFRVAGQVHEGPLCLCSGAVMAWRGVDDVAGLLALADDIDVLFYGTGAEIARMPTVALNALEAAGVGVEAMITPSACRTYNVMLSEGRRVALAALPV